MTELAIVASLGALLVLTWRAAVEARGLAFEAAREACERQGLQLLDGTVAFRSWRARRTDGRLVLERTYLFDYSDDGAARRQGFVILRAGVVELVGFGPTLVERPLA